MSYSLGSLEWVESLCKTTLRDFPRENCIALGDSKEILALFYLQDSIKENAKATIKALRLRGIESVILSGDNEASVAKIAQTLGISKFLLVSILKKRQM